MLRKLSPTIGIILCVAFGWAFGYIRWPYVEYEERIWVGVVGALGAIGFLYSVYKIFLSRPSDADHSTTKKRLNLPLFVMVVFLAVSTGFAVIQSKNLSETNELVMSLEQQVDRQQFVEDSILQNEWMSLLKSVIEKAENEADDNPERKLSEATVQRIAAISRQFKPYVPSPDTFHGGLVSPQRGQLLMALVNMNLHPTSFGLLKMTVSFANADLAGADLKGKNLSGINLSHAYLERADLRNADLSRAKLDGMNASVAQLQRANLSGSSIKRAKLGWSFMDSSICDDAIFDGTDLSNINMIHSSLRNTSFKWVTMPFALFNRADLTEANFEGAKLSKSNFDGSVLNGTIFKRAEIKGVWMDGASVDSTWAEDISSPYIIGSEQLIDVYAVITDSTGFKLKRSGH